MSIIGANQIGFRQFGVLVNVPNNDVARLMYYLDCVCTVIEYKDNDINRYRNDANWSLLSAVEVHHLLVLCLALSPDIFDNKVFFHSDALCKDMGNNFYEITQVRNQFMVVQSIVIAGRSCQVNKIMTYKMSWMRENYLEPVQRLSQRIKDEVVAARARQAEAARVRQAEEARARQIEEARVRQKQESSLCVIL